MEISGRYYDGLVADVHPVSCSIESMGASLGNLIIAQTDGQELARWPVAEVFEAPARRNELCIGLHNRSTAERLVIRGYEDVTAMRAWLPALAQRQRADRGRQVRIAAAATVVVGTVIGGYLLGVPLLAGWLVGFVPPAMEAQMGEVVAEQMNTDFAAEAGFRVCDTDPQSLANRAIDRFAKEAMAGTNSPFTPTITVVDSAVPNAFALPGGQSFYFSALLDQTETPEEFAGVMAHELGHVVYRHGMEKLISTAGTGLVIGFVLGDMTGLSVAGGAALINSSFSRDAEREADQYAAGVAARMNFQPTALADLLERVSADDEFTTALALLNTHPLTAERRLALDALKPEAASAVVPPFTSEEWVAIKTMCGAYYSLPAALAAPVPTPAPVQESVDASPPTGDKVTKTGNKIGRGS